MLIRYELARFLLALMVLFIAVHTANAFKPESVVIYENPTDNDFIKIYTTKPDVTPLLKSPNVKKIEVDREDDYTIFTVYTSLGEKVGLFERRISGRILKDLSSIGRVYIYIDKGCTVTGKIKLVKSEGFKDLYEVLGYDDITYRLRGEILYELLTVVLVIPVTSFALSRIYARKVFLSDLSREEKIYRIRKLMTFSPIPLAIILSFLMIVTNSITVYDMIAGYFFGYNKMLFAIGFLSIFLICYALFLISVILGHLPYYKELKREKIKAGRSAKYVVLTIAMFTIPMLVWFGIIINLPKSILKTELIIPLFIAFMFALMIISPNILTFFHRAERLEGPLRDEILEFCKRCGIKVSDVKVMNLPERIANAGVSGILHRYVFITDCLLEFSRDELMAVIAHEIGHLKEKHNLINGLFAISFFTTWIFASKFIDFSKLGPYGFMVIWLAVLFLFFVLLGRLMIYLEFRADRYAASVVGEDTYVRALSRLAEINVMKRRTGKLFNILNLHPSIEERIKRLSTQNNRGME